MVVEKEGFLVKAPLSVGRKDASLFSGFSHKKNHKRYFVLKGNVLSYYEKQDITTKAKGNLELGHDSIVKQEEKSNGLVVIPFPGSKKELYVEAESESSAKEWYDALKQACEEGSDEVEQKSDESELDENETDVEEFEEGEEEQVEEENSKDETKVVEPTSRPRSFTENGREAKYETIDIHSEDFQEWKREWVHKVYPKTRLPNIEYYVQKQGYMTKDTQSLLDLTSHKRYFVLRKNLEYYDSEEAFKNGELGKEIPLDVVNVHKNENPEKFEFKLFAVGYSMTLKCDSKEDYEDWVEKIKNINRNLKPVREQAPTQRKRVATEEKIVPDFLVNIKQRAESEGALGTNSYDLGEEEEDDEDENHVFPPPDEDFENEEENDAKIVEESNDDVESSPQDRFAKLRALKKEREANPPPPPPQFSSEETSASSASAVSQPSVNLEQTTAIEAPDKPATAGIEEDRFAKLRALKAARENK